jgi:ElaB/YqjD/DUF883 family membrane-anchored ribosome-binding protein
MPLAIMTQTRISIQGRCWFSFNWSKVRTGGSKTVGKTIDNATGAAVGLAHLAHEVSKAKVLLADAVGDGKRKAQRLAKNSYVAVEDCIEDTTYYIKRHPWESVAISAGIGALAGLVVGLLCTRGGSRIESSTAEPRQEV